MADVRNEEVAALVQQELGNATSAEFLDLVNIKARPKNITLPRFSIPYTGYTGRSSVRGAEEISLAAQARKRTAPTPAALIVVKDKENSQILYGIPTMQSNPSFLALEWEEKGRRVKANMMKVLQGLQIAIPAGTRMVMDVEYYNHPDFGHCVKLSWGQNCFVPMNEEPDSEE